MNLWVKICANTSFGDARLAAEAGADAVGFVFAPSPRRVTPEQVAEIVPNLPAALEKIGVFVDDPFEEIVRTIETARLTGVQLHFNAAPALPAKLKRRFGANLRVLRVVHFEAGRAMTDLEFDNNVDAVLVDSRTSTAVGGTGKTFNWPLASETLFRNIRPHKRLIAAGGLNPENVAEAIAILQPWGVDVVSGVEAAPGRKDQAKVRAFVAAARRSNAERTAIAQS